MLAHYLPVFNSTCPPVLHSPADHPRKALMKLGHLVSKEITQVEFRASTLKRYHKGKLTKRVYPEWTESNHNTQIIIEATKL